MLSFISVFLVYIHCGKRNLSNVQARQGDQAPKKDVSEGGFELRHMQQSRKVTSSISYHKCLHNHVAATLLTLALPFSCNTHALPRGLQPPC